MSGEPVVGGIVVSLQPSSKLSEKMDMQAEFWKMSWFVFEGKNGNLSILLLTFHKKFNEMLDEIHLD